MGIGPDAIEICDVFDLMDYLLALNADEDYHP